MGKLTARKVETAKPGKYGDGGGLQLAVAPTGAKKWVLRFLWQGNAREMGLGAYPEVGLAEAREKAIAGRRLARSGVDPIAERRKDRGIPTFGELADEIADQLAEGFRNEKHRAQWRMTLTVYAGPLRAKPVDVITTERIWPCSTNLATKARDGFSPSRSYRARSQRRQGEGLAFGRKPRRMAWPSREPSTQAAEAHPRPPCGYALCRCSGLRCAAPGA